MIKIIALPDTPLNIGRAGEHNARQVEFDISSWVNDFGDGIVNLIFQRPREAIPYPCVIEQDGNKVLWTITRVETARIGNFGQCELSYSIDDKIVKSSIWQVIVETSMNAPSEEVPNVMQSYMEQIVAAGATALSSAERVEAIKEEIETLENNVTLSEQTVKKSENNVKNLEKATEQHKATALTSEQNIKKMESNVSTLANNVNSSAQDAKKSEENAKKSETNSQAAAKAAIESAQEAGEHSEEAEKHAETAANFVAQVDKILASIKSKIGEVTLLTSKWTGKDHLWHQVVSIDGVTEYSQVDLTPSVEQLVIFYEKDLTFVTENEDGVVTVYAIGQKPTNDYTIQVTITEVNT